MIYEFDVVVVAPNTAIDSYYVLPELAAGDVNRAAQTLHTAGGKGNNMARAVVLLGGRVVSLGIVGGSSGQFIVDELQREGIASDMVWAEHETRRTSTVLVTSLRQSTVVLENGVPVGDKACEALTDKVLAYAAKAPFVTLTGSLPPDFPDDYYARLIDKLNNLSVRVVVDCSGKLLELATKACPTIVKVNAREFCLTFGIPVWSWQAAETVFTNLGINILIVTDGAQGAYVFARECASFRVITKVESWVNTTGAGDTFTAGLLLALNRGATLKESAKFASAAAAASLQQIGSGFLDLKDVERYQQVTDVEVLVGESA
jgi:1-phosphofructokinase family hexose kinase